MVDETVFEFRSTDTLNKTFLICAVILSGNEYQLKKIKITKILERKRHEQKCAPATIICIPNYVQQIISLREHVVTGSLDQSRESTQTSGATEKKKSLHSWVTWPQVACHNSDKKTLRLTQWQESKSSNLFETKLVKWDCKEENEKNWLWHINTMTMEGKANAQTIQKFSKPLKMNSTTLC